MTQADELLRCQICNNPLFSQYSSAGRNIELGYVGGNGKMRTYHETCVAKAIAGIAPHPDTAAAEAIEGLDEAIKKTMWMHEATDTEPEYMLVHKAARKYSGLLAGKGKPE